jgi:hypothetical protein
MFGLVIRPAHCRALDWVVKATGDCLAAGHHVIPSVNVIIILYIQKLKRVIILLFQIYSY